MRVLFQFISFKRKVEMLNLIVVGGSYLFPAGRAFKLAKDAINVTNSTNPIIFTKNITLVTYFKNATKTIKKFDQKNSSFTNTIFVCLPF